MNNKYGALAAVEFYLITPTDTIKATVTESKIIFPKIDKDFRLSVKIEGEVLDVDAYRPSEFYKTLNIVIGKITNLKKITRTKKDPNMFMIDEMYPLNISHPEKTKEYVYCMFESHLTTPGNKAVLGNRQFGKITKPKN